MNFTSRKIFRSGKFIGLPQFKYLLLSFLFVCTSGYTSCLGKRIMFFNRDSNMVEVYRIQDPTKEITKSDLLWQSPKIERGYDIYNGAGYEIKPIIYNGQKAILTTTKNGVIIYSYPDKNVLFHREIFGWPMYIHSALPLPDGNVLVADVWGWVGILFPGENDAVNQLSLKTYWYPLSFAHSLVYDSASELIYAGGYMTVKSYRYQGAGSSATLEPVAKYDARDYYFGCATYGKCDEGAQLEDGIHDMYPASKTNPHLFFLSTGERTFLFDTSEQERVSYPQKSIPIKLKTYQPFYEMDSKYSQQAAPNSRRDGVILKKGGIKALSGGLEPDDNYCVIGHAAPFFTLSLQYDYYAPVVIYGEKSEDRVNYDLTTKNHIQFAPDVEAHFYKVRLLPDDF